MKPESKIRRAQHTLQLFAEQHESHGCIDGQITLALASFAAWVLDEPETMTERILHTVRAENRAESERN